MSSNRVFEISGYVKTSHGKVKTTVSQAVTFSSNQFFNINATQYVQDISQTSVLASETRTSGGGVRTITNQLFNFPLTLNISQVVQSNGNINLTTTADQNYTSSASTTQSNKVTSANSLVDTAQHTDTLEFDSSFNLLGNTGQSSGQ